MRFNVELAHTQRSRGQICIEADSLQEAEARAEELDAADIEAWNPFDADVLVLAVTPAVERTSDGARAPRTEESARPPTDVQEALRRVVDYLYDDEAEDYQTLPKGEQVEHIFEDVAVLAKWLTTLERP